jgi:hypothetical protein
VVKALERKVDYILVDRMNYNYADRVYTEYQLQDNHSDDFFYRVSRQFADACINSRIECRFAF